MNNYNNSKSKNLDSNILNSIKSIKKDWLKSKINKEDLKYHFKFYLANKIIKKNKLSLVKIKNNSYNIIDNTTYIDKIKKNKNDKVRIYSKYVNKSNLNKNKPIIKNNSQIKYKINLNKENSMIKIDEFNKFKLRKKLGVSYLKELKNHNKKFKSVDKINLIENNTNSSKIKYKNYLGCSLVKNKDYNNIEIKRIKKLINNINEEKNFIDIKTKIFNLDKKIKLFKNNNNSLNIKLINTKLNLLNKYYK